MHSKKDTAVVEKCCLEEDEKKQVAFTKYREVGEPSCADGRRGACAGKKVLPESMEELDQPDALEGKKGKNLNLLLSTTYKTNHIIQAAFALRVVIPQCSVQGRRTRQRWRQCHAHGCFICFTPMRMMRIFQLRMVGLNESVSIYLFLLSLKFKTFSAQPVAIGFGQSKPHLFLEAWPFNCSTSLLSLDGNLSPHPSYRNGL